MSFSPSQLVTIIATLGAAVLAVVGNVLYMEWRDPDLRFQIGDLYASDKVAIASIRLRNFGSTDAKMVRLHTTWKADVRDIAVSDKTVKLEISPLPMGVGDIAVQLDRIAPGQELSVFFALGLSATAPIDAPDAFLKSVSYENGIGRSGEPFWGALKIALIASLITLTLVRVYQTIVGPWLAERTYAHLVNLIEFAASSGLKGLSGPDFQSQLGSRLLAEKNFYFRRQTMKRIAELTYARFRS